MATATVDSIVDVAFKEENGQIKSLTRKAQISGLSSTAADALVAEMRAATGLPAANSTFTIGTSTLALKTRDFKVSGDRQKAECQLEYELSQTADGGQGDGTPSAFEGGTSLQQVTTQKYRNGTAVTVTYGSDTVPVELQYLEPQNTLKASITITTSTPGSIADAWGGKLNSATWNGSAAGTWMCMNATFKIRSWEDSTWDFSFDFQQNKNGWAPQGVYIDPKTNQPPSDWLSAGAYVNDTGRYDSLDFATLFPA